MPGKSYTGPQEPLNQNELEIQRNLKSHVSALLAVGRRTMRTSPQGLEAAARYIESAFAKSGYETTPLPYECDGRTVRNIQAVLEGTDRSPSREYVVVGAHYDAEPDTPGANDNATGVAMMLEIARLMKAPGHSPPRRTVRFVAFVNEEVPDFWTSDMGSYRYAKMCRDRDDKIVAMFCLDMVGHYSHEKHSQAYPSPYNLALPDPADYILFSGRYRDQELVRQCVGAFRETTRFPCNGVAIFSWYPRVWYSDHWSFWHFNYPAMEVFCPAKYPQIHTPADTMDQVSWPDTARVAGGMARVVARIAGAEPPATMPASSGAETRTWRTEQSANAGIDIKTGGG